MRRREDAPGGAPGNRYLAGFYIADHVRVEKLERGALWEGPGYVVYDLPVEATDSCPHIKLVDGHQTVCPLVIVLENEGGYNGTGLCLDCILEDFR